MKVLFVLFALVAAASASDLGQYGDEQEHQDVEHTPYEFSYAVEDDDTVFSQSEQGDEEGDVEGEYAVNLPDGRVQTVRYSAGDETGYTAEVSYEGEAQYPEQDSYTNDVGAKKMRV
ncbi:adult-specific cuticular protein ACP-20-like [Amphibalanus amphitrite]|uniref:adult-specific cuticular protein ACP-20-like n=1 Tax=Amphibalanus amphitrite TaxID=1232801 RepID=UPI001C9075DF|nr:adult-specific cuticular protein ACP-20-like [Amphibalanus amphitrite]